MGRILLLAGVVCLSTMGRSEAQEGAGAAALAQLRGLAGEWEGSFQWTGARTATGRAESFVSRLGVGDASGPPSVSAMNLYGADELNRVAGGPGKHLNWACPWVPTRLWPYDPVVTFARQHL
jgi:hypothetical protein